MQHLKVRRELEFGNFKFYGGEREGKQKKKNSGGLPYLGGIPEGEVAKSAVHSNFKCKTSKTFTGHTLILTFHIFR